MMVTFHLCQHEDTKDYYVLIKDEKLFYYLIWGSNEKTLEAYQALRKKFQFISLN